MNAPHAAQAVAALTGKVQRLRASAASQLRGAARKLELADGLERLAPLLAHGPAEVRRRLDRPMGQGISAEARKHAGNEIHALARKRLTQGSERNALARVCASWERGGGDLGLSIHRDTLQEAVALRELAEAIHPQPCWTWTRAGLLLRLGHDTAAAERCGSAGGDNARHVPAKVDQCQAKVVGTLDPLAEQARHFVAQVVHCEAYGVDPAPLTAVQSRLGQLLSRALNDCSRDLEYAADALRNCILTHFSDTFSGRESLARFDKSKKAAALYGTKTECRDLYRQSQPSTALL
jgi:hypothetical protein